MFLAAFESEGLVYTGEGAQIVHPELTWSISLVVNSTGPRASHRLVLGASLPQLGTGPAPRAAEDCYLFLPLSYEIGDEPQSRIPRMPAATFPEWSGTESDRAAAIEACVAGVASYARDVDCIDALRTRYAEGDYDDADIVLPLRVLLEATP